MPLNFENWIVAIAASLIGTSVLVAVPTDVLDSSEFAFRYEMNVLPNTQDLDGNGTGDFFTNASIIPVAGGFATNSAQDQIYRGDFGGSVWRSEVPNGDYTLEFSVQVANSTGSGAMGLAIEKPGDAGQGLRLNVSQSGQSTNSVNLGSTDNTDTQHTFRVVHQGAGQYFLYRDGVALNGGAAVTGANNANNDNIFIGDFSGSLQGDYSIDYLRLTQGAFAPGAASDAANAQVQLGFDFTSGTVASQNGGVVVDDSGSPSTPFEAVSGNPVYSAFVPPASSLQNVTGIGSVDLTGGAHRLQSIATVATSGLTDAAITAAGGVTIEAWVNVNSTPGRGTILGVGDAFVLENDNGLFRLLTNSSNNPTPTILIDDADKANGGWIHLAGVFGINPGSNNNTSSIFMNGELIDMESGLNFIPVFDAVGNRAITIGTGFNFPQFVYDGLIYEPRISLGALTADQFTFAPPVPEPGTAALLLLSAGAMMRRRRSASAQM